MVGCYIWRITWVSFKRNCGAASVGECNKIIWLYFYFFLRYCWEYRRIHYHRCVLNDDVTMVFVLSLFCKVLGKDLICLKNVK